MRKAFNFFNSYWQTANELPDKDRLAFYDALLYYQFTGDNSKLEQLKGMAKFAYVSQSHSIESQIKGYYDNCKKLKINAFNNPALPPALGGALGAALPPALQEKEEVKEKVKEQRTIKSKIFFSESNIFDKHKFKEAFPEWNKDKLAYYYETVLTWSNEGNKKIDWVATVRNWALRDEKQGKIKFESKNKTVNLGGLI